ncbi:MAG: Xaa-Pro peptidase family protein [Armatimonadota bacterium]|nr:Xaa-Pro peptidase family protein [Armatimonadota bacterium]
MFTVAAPASLDRLTRLRARLDVAGTDAAVLAKPANVTYVSGFTGSTGLAVVTAREAFLVVDFRYVEQAAAQTRGFACVRANGPLIEGASEIVRRTGARRVAVEAEYLPVGQFRKLAEGIAPAEAVPVDGIDHIRWVKSAEEIAAIRRSLRVAEAAFLDVVPLIRVGAVERDIAVALEERLRRLGSQRLPFDVIVASGPRAALPHGVASDRVIGRGECVTVDFGAIVDGYVSDCTRTVVTAPVTARHREIYGVVLAAQRAALAGLRPGLTGREADALARDVIATAGHADAFGHSLGHGVGLAVHEGPTLSPREEAVLSPGAVVTVEPGVYLPGWGGVRIEDLVVITDDGCDNLTTLPKDLIEVGA